MMKVLKSSLLVSLFVLFPSFASAGLLDRVFPLLLRSTGNVLRMGVPSDLLNNFERSAARVRHYGTQNRSEDDSDDPPCLPDTYSPYCHHHADWPARVARGEIVAGGGSIFSDMLMQRYLLDQDIQGQGTEDGHAVKKEEEEEEAEEPLPHPGGTFEGVLDRMRDPWVHDYFNGRGPRGPVGIMGEQVLDAVFAEMFSENEEDLPDVEPFLDERDLMDLAADEEDLRALAALLVEGDVRRCLHEIVERNANYMTGAVDVPDAAGSPEAFRLFAPLHEAMVKVYQKEFFDVEEYTSAIKKIVKIAEVFKKE